jgi:hypothetical protein
VEVRPRSKHLSASLRGCLSVHGTDCKRSMSVAMKKSPLVANGNAPLVAM